MKRTEPRAISSIIDEALSKTGNANVIDEQRACYVWTEIVGPGVNRYTTRRYVSRGEMHVYLSSAALKNELSFHRSEIVRLINQAVGRDVISTLILH